MPRTGGTRGRARPERERKNLRLDQSLLDAARRALGAETETETVTIALQRVLDNRRIAAGLRALGGSGIVDPARVHDGPGE